MAMDLGDADPSSMVASAKAPVLAFTGGDTSFVLHCDPESEDGCDGLLRTDLPELRGGNAVLITSAGEYVVATDKEAHVVRAWTFDDDGRVVVNPQETPPIDDLQRLVASLRNSNWIIGRDIEGRLVRFHPELRPEEVKRIAPDHDDMMLAAVGEQYVIGRVALDGKNEELYLIRVGETLDEPGTPPPPLWLSTAPIASRIVITPRDELVAVTYGEGDNAMTRVFRVPDGRNLQTWQGAMVSGRGDVGEMPGLRAVSPDGSHIAYRTEQGSLAMRSLDAHSSCLVQSARHDSATRLAGFSAHGVLYFETDEGPGRTAINTWTPHRKERRRLSSGDQGYVLTTVPAQLREGDEVPWAVGARHGIFATLHDGSGPKSLAMDGAVPMPRDDGDLWVVQTQEVENETQQIGLRRIVPRWSDQLRALAFDDPSDPPYDHNGELEYLSINVSGPSRVCMSTGAPGSWAYSCGSASDRTFLAAPSTPSSEDPSGRPSDDPEIPEVGDAYDCGEGEPAYRVDRCRYNVDGCCFEYLTTACDWRGCDGECNEVEGPPRTVTCGPASAGPSTSPIPSAG